MAPPWDSLPLRTHCATRTRCPPRLRLRSPPPSMLLLMPSFSVHPLRSRLPRLSRGLGRMRLLLSPHPQPSPMA
eukprot:3733923-Pleurochrysis_carterae.AAC.1